MLVEPRCCTRQCKHFTGVTSPDEVAQRPCCAAFPDGIPDDVAYGDNLHEQPIPGDHGILYENEHETVTKSASRAVEERGPHGARRWRLPGGEISYHEPKGNHELPTTNAHAPFVAESTPIVEQSATINPEVAAKRTPAQQRESLEQTPVASSLTLGGGCNVTRLLELEDGTQGVFKPAYGEEPYLREGVKAGTYWRREIAAYRVAEILGFEDLVPATTKRKEEGKEGSIQAYVGNAKLAIDTESDKMFDGDEDLARAAVFDYLLCNLDRHSGNWLLKDGKLVLIDNGLSFPVKYDSTDFHKPNQRVELRAKEKRLPVPNMASIKDKWLEIEKSLREIGIEDEAINLAEERFDALTSGEHRYLDELPSLIGDRLLSRFGVA